MILSQSPASPRIDKRRAIDQLWRRGNLKWKLDKNQLEMYDFLRNQNHKVLVIGSSRRLGKSYFLVTAAIEECLKKPFAIVKFIAPKVKDIRKIIAPLMREIMSDAPRDLMPKYNTQDHVFRFKNGSEIQLAGTDNGHADSIRGGSADLCIVDEAGFCDDLDYVVNSILIPTTTTTRGKIVMASTPSVSPDHPFIGFMQKAELDGRFIKKTIYDNPRMTEEMIQEIAEPLGGKDSVDFRREYLVEIIVSEEDAVVPEFTQELQSEIVYEVPRPAYCDNYISMDIGGNDLTFIIFAHYDFATSRIIIEDELVFDRRVLSDEIAALIKEKERKLWLSFETGEVKAPYLRIADNNNIILLNDLAVKHGLNFIPTLKDNKVAELNNMRILLKTKRIIINPKCRTLISHLKGATWNKARNSYTRSADKGHYDGVDALVYLCRNINFSRNPYPANYNFDPNASVFTRQEPTQLTSFEQALVSKVINSPFRRGRKLKY